MTMAGSITHSILKCLVAIALAGSLSHIAVQADDLAPSRQSLDQGLREITYYNFQPAQQHLRQALAQLPASQHGQALWQKIVYALATTHHYMTPASESHVKQAEQFYRQLIEQSQSPSPLATRAMLNLGRLAEVQDYRGDQTDLPAAQAWYRQAMQAGQGQAIQHEAAMRLGALFLQQHEKPEVVRQGITFMTAYMKEHPNHFFAGPMWQLMGEAYATILHEPDAAAEAFVQADACGIVSAQPGFYYWRIANMDEKAGRMERAIRYYKKIITHAPNSGRAYESQIRLQKLKQAHPELVGDIPTIELLLDTPPQSTAAESASTPSQAKGQP